MSGSVRRVWLVLLLLELSFFLAAVLAPVRAAGSIDVTLDYSVTPLAYDNVVRVADPYTMDYPRILVDGNRDSPGFGTVYVLGTHQTNYTDFCVSPIVSRSTDGGRTFSPPQAASICLPERSAGVAGGLYAIGDATVGPGGALYLAAGWQGILRSSDGGGNWTFLPAWASSVFVSGLSVDPLGGRLYAVGTPYALANETARLQVATSSDGGIHWNEPSTLPLISRGFSEATIAADREALVVAAVTQANMTGTPTYSVVAIGSSDGGETWANASVLASTTDFPLTPQVRVSPRGVFGVSWETTEHLPLGDDSYVIQPGISISRSSDNGRTFSAPAQVSGNASSLIGPHGIPIAFDNASRMYVAWSSTVSLENATQSFLYTAISAPGESTNGSFATHLQYFGVNVTEMEDLTMGLNDTAFLVWYTLNFDANFTTITETSGIFVRTATGAVSGNVTDPAEVLGGTTMIEVRDSRGQVAARVAWDGSPIVFEELVPDTYGVTVADASGSISAGSMPVDIWGRTVFSIRVTPQSAPAPPLPAFPWLPLMSLAIGLAALGAVLGTMYYAHRNRRMPPRTRCRPSCTSASALIPSIS